MSDLQFATNEEVLQYKTLNPSFEYKNPDYSVMILDRIVEKGFPSLCACNNMKPHHRIYSSDLMQDGNKKFVQHDCPLSHSFEQRWESGNV